jgi:hypothetical protein
MFLVASPLAVFAQEAIPGEGEADVGQDVVLTQQWQYGLMIAVPFIVGWLTKSGWDSRKKMVALIIVATVASLGTMFLNGQLDDLSTANIVAKTFAVIGGAYVFYRTFLKDSALGTRVADLPSPLPGK